MVLVLRYALGSFTRETPWMKILVIDDHVLIREAMHGVLRELKGELPDHLGRGAFGPAGSRHRHEGP